MKLLLLLLLLLCNLYFIQSSTSAFVLTIKILEIEDHKNERNGYPISSIINQCSFKDNRFLFIDTEENGEIIGIATSPSYLSYNLLQKEGGWSVYSFSTQGQSILIGVTIFQITVTSKSNLQQIYQFNYTCNGGDYTNVNVLPNQGTTLRLVSDLSYCAPIYVYGINFNLNYLTVTLNGISTQIEGKNNEFCYGIPRKLIEDLSITEFILIVPIGSKVFNITYIPPLLGIIGINSISTSAFPSTSLLVQEIGMALSSVITFEISATNPLISNSQYQYIFSNVSGTYYTYPYPSYGNRQNGITYTSTFIDNVSATLTSYYLRFIMNGVFVEKKFDKTTTDFPLQMIPNIQIGDIVNLGKNLQVFEILFAQTDYNFNLYSFYYGGGGLEMISAPYGFWNGNNSEFTFKISALRGPGGIPSTTYFFCSSIIPTASNCIDVPTIDVITDNQPPKITSYQFIHLIDSIYRLVLTVVDESGVLVIKSNSFLTHTNNILDSLINGDLKNGTYEFICDVNLDTTLTLIDIYKNVVSDINSDYYISLNLTTDQLLHYKLPNIVKQSFSTKSFLSVTFEKNNLNLLQGNSYNSIYIVGNGIPIDKIFYLELTDPINYDIESKVSKGMWPIRWDNSSNRFIGKFILQSNTIFGIISYNIHLSPPVKMDGYFEPDIITNLQLSGLLGASSQLVVSESNLDNAGPMIDLIEKSFEDTGSLLNVSWELQISDTLFNFGYVKVMGSIDNSIYHFNFTSATKIKIAIPVTKPCITQDFVIVYIKLVDLFGQESIFEMFTDNPKPTRNPLRNYIDKRQYLRSTCTCTGATVVDTTPPSIVSLTAFPSQMDVLGENRIVQFQFEVSDFESGIKQSQLPIIYIQDCKMDTIKCITQIEYYKPGEEDKTIGYNCSIEIPYGFGYPGNLIFSIYGLINNNGLYKGYTTTDLLSEFNTRGYLDTSITTITFGSSPKIISHHLFTSLGGTLVLFGRSFEYISNTIQIQFPEVVKIHNYTAKSITPKSIIIDGIPVTGNFPIIVNIFNNQTNQILDSYLFYPIFFNTTFNPNQFTPTPTETITPVVTNSPTSKKCIGNPECGGKSNGYCDQGINCICYSPWVGIDCTSQVIIIPKPVTNNTNPSTEIPIKDDDDESTSNYLFKSLISIVSLRELNYNGDKSIKEFIFDKWILNEINSNKNQYFTSIKSNDGKSSIDIITNVTVELEWFNTSTIIEFANSKLTMNPSTIKYTIYITEYPFSSNLNQLQLIMSAKFESQSSKGTTCSLNEFGEESVDGDNYLKIQIKDHSLNGRFIKRAIIDSKFISVTNKLLDSSLNEININQQQDKSQSFIGINIPNYQSSVIIDPDFSVLLDSFDASTNENSICNNTLSSSKLTAAQLSGIIIGSIAFVTVVAISVVYYYFKKKQNLKFKTNMENKLKNVK